MDTWINGYNLPQLDEQQDIYNMSGKLEDGFTTLSFVRKRSTTDIKVQIIYLFIEDGPITAHLLSTLSS